MNKTYDELRICMDKAMAIKTAMALPEWDNETPAPREAGELISKVIGALSGEYFQAMTCEEMKKLLERYQDGKGLTTAETVSVRELLEEREQICPIPRNEYQGFARLTAGATDVWARAKGDRNLETFAPTFERIIGFQGKFAGCRAKDGKKLYDVMLDDYEKGFSTENLDRLLGMLKKELVPFLGKVMEEGKRVEDSFLKDDYPEKKQEGLGRFLAEYVGFNSDRDVMAVNAHPFTTNPRNKDVRITTHYTDCVDSPPFSVIHEAGYAIYELGIGDDLTLTPVGQGASMGMHESQLRFFENIIGRSHSFQVSIYVRIQKMFPERLGKVGLNQFVEAVNEVTPGLIRTEADEPSCSLHILIRYGIEKMLTEENLDAKRPSQLRVSEYEEHLGMCPENPAEGILQDTHWSQDSSGYFPSYTLDSTFGAQSCYHMKEIMDFDGLLKEGKMDVIRDYPGEHIHQYRKLKDNRQILKDVAGEDFKPEYYVRYLKERYSAVYGLQ